MRATLALLVVLALSASRIGSAQTAPPPTRLENVQYYKVEYHRFKPGKAEEGRAFIRKYYRPADRAAGIQVLEFTPVTGDWDWIAFFPVEPDFLVWQRPAMSLRARAKFEQMAGGADESTKLDKDFDDLVQEVRIEIMMRSLESELNATDYYGPLFSAAFGSPEATRERIAKALAQFLRSMISFEAKWDRALLQVSPAPPPDPTTVLTAQEQRGWDVFIEQQCGHCHQTPGFFSPGPANDGLDEVFTDPGAGEGAFRPAALKNIAASGPYMHDGRFATLRQVIEHYDSGVKSSPFVHPAVDLQRNMSGEDKAALEAFLNTLTDEAFLTNPKFSDPFL